MKEEKGVGKMSRLRGESKQTNKQKSIEQRTNIQTSIQTKPNTLK